MAILLTWAAGRLGHGQLADIASLALVTMTFLGTFFSIYLTFLEQFVIGATCAWCLASEMIMTTLLALAAPHSRRHLKSPTGKGATRSSQGYEVTGQTIQMTN